MLSGLCSTASESQAGVPRLQPIGVIALVGQTLQAGRHLIRLQGDLSQLVAAGLVTPADAAARSLHPQDIDPRPLPRSVPA